MWGERGGVGAGMGGDCHERLWTSWVPLGNGWLEYGYLGTEGSLRTTFTVPSHELEQKLSLVTRFQCTAKTSLLCSFHDCTGKSSRPMSKSLTEPSPAATRTWFSCVSDQERS